MTTPADRWKRMIAAYRRRCQDIVGSAETIRYAGVINAYGRTLTGVLNPSARPLLRSADAQNEFFVVSTAMSLRGASTGRLGALEHVILVHKRVYIVLVRKGDATYYISVSRREGDIEGLVSKIKKIVSRRA